MLNSTALTLPSPSLDIFGGLRALRRRAVRERGLTLIEVIAVLTIVMLIAGQQLSNYTLERTKGIVGTSASTMATIGLKVAEFCNDNQSTCPAPIVSGSAVALPSAFMPMIAHETGSGAAFTVTVASYADNTQCFSLEGTLSFNGLALLSIPKSDGTFPTVAAATGTVGYLHFDSRSGGVYQTATNTSPVAGGC